MKEFKENEKKGDKEKQWKLNISTLNSIISLKKSRLSTEFIPEERKMKTK